MNSKTESLRVTFEQAVAGLSNSISIKQESSEIEDNKWVGFSADRKIKLEVIGTIKDVTGASLAIFMKLDGGKLSSAGRSTLSQLLRNIFPEWSDREVWIDRSIAAIAADRSAVRSNTIRRITSELRSDSTNSIRLRIDPESPNKQIRAF